MDRICSEKFVPTPTDVLRARVRTHGVIETHFKINDNIVRYFNRAKSQGVSKNFLCIGCLMLEASDLKGANGSIVLMMSKLCFLLCL